MTPEPGDQPTPRPRRITRDRETSSPASVTPSAWLASITKDRIDALEKDRRDLREEHTRLRSEVVRLVSENARIVEALGNADSNNVLATILIGVGGFLVSYATFTGNLAAKLADGAAGCLLTGIALMVWQSARRWRRG